MTLTQLAEKYGCDKLHSHSYMPLYEELFQGMQVRRLLEIGIGYMELMLPFVPFYVHGGSLKMWSDFFPEAQIYACDIRSDTLINEGRIQSFVCDQNEERSLLRMMEKIGQSLDVIIDDGSHQTAHQILTAITLLPSVRAGGAYVIEDCQEPERVHAAVGGEIHKFGKRPDDNLVVIKR